MNLKDIQKIEIWNKNYNKAIEYSNKQQSKGGYICKEQRINCTNYADGKITWKEFKELYKII